MTADGFAGALRDGTEEYAKAGEHTRNGYSCNGCDWTTANILKSIAVDHAEHAARHAATEQKALRDAARYLRQQATRRFAQHGPHDARGAALWDAGCAIDPDDGNALGGA